MNSKSNRASERGDKARRRAKLLDLSTARRMLPLVQRIVTDIVQDSDALNRYTFEQESLDRDKRNLSWPERQRRYALEGEVSRLQGRLDEERKELAILGAVITNPSVGQIGFPTVINGQAAYFSWQMGEDGVNYWHFAGEATRRPIPPQWNDDSHVCLASYR